MACFNCQLEQCTCLNGPYVIQIGRFNSSDEDPPQIGIPGYCPGTLYLNAEEEKIFLAYRKEHKYISPIAEFDKALEEFRIAMIGLFPPETEEEKSARARQELENERQFVLAQKRHRHKNR
jgi:hypothetical protein